MKRINPIFLVIVALLAVFAGACKDSSTVNLATIAIYLDTGAGFRPMTITPEMPLEVSEYRVYGSGPASSAFELMTGESTCVVDELLPGEWMFGAEGLNSSGEILFAGVTSSTVDRDTGEITIHLSEPEGEGTLTLTFSWDESLVLNPLLTVEMANDEETTAFNPTISAGSAMVNATLEAGLYEMRAILSSDGEHVAGAADYVKIIANHDTIGSIALNIVLMPVSPTVAVKAPCMTPFEIEITGYEPPVFTGSETTLSAGAEIGPGTIFTWFIDGVWAADGQDFILDTGTPCTKRIDVLANADGFASGGSASLEVSVHDPVYYGSLVFIESLFDNDGGVDGLSGVREVAVDGSFLYTAGYGEDEIGFFSIDGASGKLTFLDIIGPADVPEPALFSGPSCLAMCAAGLAAGCSGSGALHLFDTAPGTGTLSYRDTIAPLPGDFSVPPGGPGDLPSDLNPLTGVSAVASNKEGTVIFAASPESDTITSYKIENGLLVPYQIISGEVLAASGFDAALIDGPEDIAVSPDGTFLTSACKSSDSLLIFDIGNENGVLTPAAAFVDGVENIEGLNGAAGLCFTPDSRHIYTTGYYDDAVSLFSNNPDTGIWFFVDSWKEDDFTAAALHYPRGIAVSPDGSELYVCAGGSDAFTVFLRDQTSGVLSSPVSAVNGSDRNTGFDGIRRVSTAGNGDFVYAVSSNDDAAVLFRRE